MTAPDAAPSRRPNILFLFADQMRGESIHPDSPCQTPTIDRLAAEGVRFSRSHTPVAITSPAQASLMTGLLPHNHGMLWVRHNVEEDQGCLREDKPQWAQRLAEAGYRTGFFTRWMVERSEELERFGWKEHVTTKSEAYKERETAARGGDDARAPSYSLQRMNDRPPGYKSTLFYGVTDRPAEERGLGVSASFASEFLASAVVGEQPWCCFYSISEPHDPFVCHERYFEKYDVDSLPLPPNVHDDLAGRPNVYRKAQRVWQGLTDRERREAMACYYASITEIDAIYGELIGIVEAAGQLDNTIVIVSSDHGEMLGAHGLYCKNLTACQEVYHVPLVFRGPGVAPGRVADARVGLHDVCPTIMDMAGVETFTSRDSRSFAPVLRDPAGASGDFTEAFAEYHGGRYLLTQRILWQDDWKFVFNGFDFDELYNLADDPGEMNNLIDRAEYAERADEMMKGVWRWIRDTGDTSLFQSGYPILRLARIGPDSILDETE